MHTRVLKFHICIPYEKIVDIFFSQQDFAPFLSNSPLKQIWTKSCQQNISKTIEARALKPGEWIGIGE